MGSDELQREIGRLEAQLDPKSSASGELAQIRRGLAETCDRKPAIELPNLRIGFACKQRWEDMVGDDRVRACAGCDRPVFNLSEMTRAEAERVLATRGLTPCVRLYRRPDGTVMTTDCPSGSRHDGRRLAVASSLAAGTALAASSAWAEPTPESAVKPPETVIVVDDVPPLMLDREYTMGIPSSRTFDMQLLGAHVEMGGVVEMGAVAIVETRERPIIEWSLWGRLGTGVAHHRPTVLARTLTPPEVESPSTWEAAATAELTAGIARDGNIRAGLWGELRTSSGPVAGGELVLENLPPHPSFSRIGSEGSVVLRAGGNAHIVTGALGVGLMGAWARNNPWIHWAGHVVGARVVASVNHSRDDPHDWSATIGLEVEPIGVVHAVVDVAKGH